MAEQQEFPLLQAGDSMPTRSLHEFKVLLIERATAAEFIEKYHYAGRLGTGKRVSFGAYFNGELYAVASYGPQGADMYPGRLLSKLTGHDVNGSNLFELIRLARIGEKGDKSRPPLTQFLAQCHRILRKQYGIKFILSFSDPHHGHEGTIYRAANFRHLGKTAPTYHCKDSEGRIVHRRVAYRYKEAINFNRYGTKPWPPEAMTIAEARKIKGLTTFRTQPKDRWFLIINGRKK